MSKDIKKALEHCIDNECVGCPNKEELGSGDIVCRARLLPEILEYVADIEAKLAEKDKEIERLNLEFETQEDWQEKWQKLYDETCNLTQDKISFAVEVLKIAQDYVQQYVNDFDDMNDCLCAIDNQIKRLTHQREDKGECNV